MHYVHFIISFAKLLDSKCSYPYRLKWFLDHLILLRRGACHDLQDMARGGRCNKEESEDESQDLRFMGIGFNACHVFY